MEQEMQNKSTEQIIINLLLSVKRNGMENLVEFLKQSDFFRAPASSKHHLNVSGGLAIHSLNVYNTLKYLNDKYKVIVSEDSLKIIGLLHDLCKVNTYMPNTLKNGAISSATPYKINDVFPIGHGEKSVIIASKYIELTPEEALCIRFHMGTFDPNFRMYGEQAQKIVPGVYLTYFADHISSLYLEK